jgi:hypothetical protein
MAPAMPSPVNFKELFGWIIESFYHETSASSIAMWSVSIEGLIFFWLVK